MTPPFTLSFAPLPLCLPAPRPAPRPVLRRWQVEYRWTHLASGQAGRSVLEFTARDREDAQGRARRVVQDVAHYLGQSAFRLEIGEVAA